MKALRSVFVFLLTLGVGIYCLVKFETWRHSGPAGDPLADARLSRLIATQESVKANMRDPDSVAREKATASDDGSVVCVVYRARNGFGGMARATAVAAVGRDVFSDAKHFDAECKRATVDMTRFI